ALSVVAALTVFFIGAARCCRTSSVLFRSSAREAGGSGYSGIENALAVLHNLRVCVSSHDSLVRDGNRVINFQFRTVFTGYFKIPIRGVADAVACFRIDCWRAGDLEPIMELVDQC